MSVSTVEHIDLEERIDSSGPVQIDDESYVQADIRYLLPLKPADRVLILGDCNALTASLQFNGMDCSQFSNWNGQPLPFDSSRFDHAFLLINPGNDCSRYYKEIARVLKQGGTICARIWNKRSLHPRSFLQGRSQSISLRSIRSVLRESGLRFATSYGVWNSFKAPVFLISLEDSNAATYFFSHMYLPRSLYAEWMRRGFRFLAQRGKQSFLFPEIAVIAEKQ